MNTVFSKAVGTMGLLGISAVALAGPSPSRRRRKSRSDFVTGGVIGAFAAGPVGAVLGAGLGTWLGNRVHRAGDAKQAEATVAALQTEKTDLQGEKSALLSDKQVADRNQSHSDREAR